jgi:5-methylcytosine-specific restriction endonuclease McrA
MPLSTITLRKVIKLLSKNKIEIVETYDDKEVVSANWCFKIPSIVRLISAIRRRQHQYVKFSRVNVFTRDGWRCQYCGEDKESKDLNIDHVVPKSKGGKTNWENVVTSCIECNSEKRNRTPQEAGMTLLTKPFRPTWLPVFSIKLTGKLPDQWRTYFYWTSELE